MAAKGKALVRVSAETFPDTRTSHARALVETLNAERFDALMISAPQRPDWRTEPHSMGEIMPERGGIKNGIFLSLHLPLWTGKGHCRWGAVDTPTLLKEGGNFVLAGRALERFEECRKRMVAFGLIKQESDAKLVINRTSLFKDSEDYDANLGVEADQVDTGRLLELRGHFERAFKIMRLIDHTFGLEQTSTKIRAPATRDDRVKIYYPDLKPEEFAHIVEDSDLIRWAGETVEIRAGFHQGLARGFPAIVALAYGAGPVEEQAGMVLDGEDADLYRKVLKLSVIKDYMDLANTDNDCAQSLLGTMQDIADGREAPALPSDKSQRKRLPPAALELKK